MMETATTRTPVKGISTEDVKYKLIAEDITASYDGIATVKNVSMKFRDRAVTDSYRTFWMWKDNIS